MSWEITKSASRSPYALYVIVSAYDKQSPHAQAMALDILYRRTISA